MLFRIIFAPKLNHTKPFDYNGSHCSVCPLQGVEVVECACMIELKALNGVGKLHEVHADVPVWSLISEDILTVKGELTTE